jgi:hypothetical protein
VPADHPFHPRPQILGADTAILTSDLEVEEFLLQHLRALRKLSFLEDVDFVTIIEQNFGTLLSIVYIFSFVRLPHDVPSLIKGGWVGASRVAAICSASTPIKHLSADSTGQHRIGVVTSYDTKESMRFAMQQLLRSERVEFSSRFVSTDIGTKEELCSQLRAYRFVDKSGEDDVIVKRRALSGKGGGKNDDLSIAAQMLAFWPSLYFDNPDRARRGTF